MKKVEGSKVKVIKMGSCGNDGCSIPKEVLPYCVKKAA